MGKLKMAASDNIGTNLKTEKFGLKELKLDCAKIFALRSKPGTIEPKN